MCVHPRPPSERRRSPRIDYRAFIAQKGNHPLAFSQFKLVSRLLLRKREAHLILRRNESGPSFHSFFLGPFTILEAAVPGGLVQELGAVRYTYEAICWDISVLVRNGPELGHRPRNHHPTRTGMSLIGSIEGYQVSGKVRDWLVQMSGLLALPWLEVEWGFPAEGWSFMRRDGCTVSTRSPRLNAYGSLRSPSVNAISRTALA